MIRASCHCGAVRFEIAEPPEWVLDCKCSLARRNGGLRISRAGMKTTRYFDEQVMRKRPYIQRRWCAEVLANPVRRTVQDDGRIRLWGRVLDDAAEPRMLRVVVLEDGETVHKAFFDRGYREDEP